MTQEFRLESRDWGAFDWQAGVYYFDEEITIDSFNYDTLAGGVQNGYAVQYQDNEAWAVFGSMDYEVSDALTLRRRRPLHGRRKGLHRRTDAVADRRRSHRPDRCHDR